MSNIKYRALLSVIEEGNLTAAAARLRYSQPGISHMIDYLEKELGFPLLTRLKTGVLPTPEANELLIHIRQLINSEDRIYEISEKIKGLETGLVRIGTYFSISVHWLPKVIGAFEKEHPNISIRLTEGDADEIIPGIKEGVLDIGFISKLSTEGMDFIPVHKDPIMAILPQNHPLSSKKIIDIEELADYPFIYPTEKSYEDIYRIIEKDKSVRFNIKYRVKGDEAILAMVAEGLGVSLMPELLLESDYDGKLLIKPLNKKYTRTLGIALKSKEYASPAVKSFVNTALKILK
ncbi:MAG: LysR family transcriptional regulator [Clostridiales bacterium]|nr:LysR family transcriptional regulator [Clostridiales bacterium]